MNKNEIITRQKQIAEEIATLDLRNNGVRSKVWKHFRELCIENSNLQRELDKLNGKTYNSEKWITKYYGSSYDSLKAARLDLINKIKNLPGVEVGDDKTGVVGVTVYTEYKIYHYIIHAHYRVEKINIRIEKGMFGDIEKYDTKQIYEAYVEPNGEQWSWRY